MAAAADAAASDDEPPRKRARADADADADDRLSELPDCLLQDILALVGSRRAVQTSVLSRRWRYVWRSVPCVDIDQREFRGAGGEGGLPTEADCDGFEDFADTVLSPTILGATAAVAAQPPLDAFRLHLLYEGRHISFGRWVRRALKRRPASVDIHNSYGGTNDWPPVLDLGFGAGTSHLKRLHLFGLHLGFISRDGKRLTELLPVLEDLHMENCTYGFGPSTSTIALPTLKSLAVVPRRYTSRHYTLIVTSPRVTCLRLFLPFTRTHAAAVRIAPEGREVLESLVSASISILDMEQEPNHLNRRMNKHKVDFLTSTRSMLDRFPNVRNLDLSGFTTIALLDKKSQEFPMLQNLRTLLLSDCDVGVRCHALRSILLNAPNLEHLRLQHCKFIDTPKRKRGNTKSKAKPSMCLDSLSSLCKNLQSMEIKWQLVDIGLQHLVEFIKEILTGRKLHFKRTIRGGMITVSIQIRSRTSIA